MTDETFPAPDDPVVEPPPGVVVAFSPSMTELRTLTPDEAASYTVRLDTAGFAFRPAGTDEPYGFDVTDGAVTYNYRYDGSATTAVELLERICAERGC